MGRTLKCLWCSIVGLLTGGVLLMLWVNIMGMPQIVDKQLLLEKVHDFALAPNGKYIAYCDTEGLKIFSLQDKKWTWLLRFRYPQEKCPVRSLKWSPDMAYIAFVRGILPEEQKLTIFHLKTKKVYVIDHAPCFTGVAWSPDSKQLAWTKDEGKTMEKFYIREQSLLMVGTLEGDRIHPSILYRDHIRRVLWSPDGQFLLFVKSFVALGVMKVNETDLKWIRPSGRFPMHGNFTIAGYDISPDSTKVAFGFGDYIWFYDLRKPEKLLMKIPSHRRLAIEVKWSPEGEGLFYVISEASQSVAPVAPGEAQTNPPHALHWIDKEGKQDQVILREEKGIYNLQLKGKEIFYISGGCLWKVTLR